MRYWLLASALMAAAAITVYVAISTEIDPLDCWDDVLGQMTT